MFHILPQKREILQPITSRFLDDFHVFQLGKLGINVVLISRTREKLEKVAQEIGEGFALFLFWLDTIDEVFDYGLIMSL